MCAAKFVDEEWYRAKIEKMSKDDVSVLYVDYGNRWVSLVTTYQHDGKFPALQLGQTEMDLKVMIEKESFLSFFAGRPSPRPDSAPCPPPS